MARMRVQETVRAGRYRHFAEIKQAAESTTPNRAVARHRAVFRLVPLGVVKG